MFSRTSRRSSVSIFRLRSWSAPPRGLTRTRPGGSTGLSDAANAACTSAGGVFAGSGLKDGEASGSRGLVGAVCGEERKLASEVTCVGVSERTRQVSWICSRAQMRAAVLCPTP